MKPRRGDLCRGGAPFRLDPAATLFIDDRAENIKAARARGWHGIEHSDYHQHREGAAGAGGRWPMKMCHEPGALDERCCWSHRMSS